MNLSIAFQMDMITNIRVETDTTFRLAEEAQKRGYRVFHYLPKKLAFDNGKVIARGNDLKVDRSKLVHSILGNERVADLKVEFDIIWLRQDPPFDMTYLSTTYLLDKVSPSTLVLNNPFWVRNFPEKLLVLEFPDLIPQTVITPDFQTLEEFRKKVGDIILKPLYGNGGIGVFHVGVNDKNFSSLYELFNSNSTEPLIAQEFLPAVSKGDKRILLLDGEILGAINRIPKSGEIRSNMHVGGVAEKAKLTDRDIQICDRIGPLLKEKGQFFVGIDVIGGMLTEINVTSPTGLQELELFEGKNFEAMVWDQVVKKLK
jgi:glutathione synthase